MAEFSLVEKDSVPRFGRTRTERERIEFDEHVKAIAESGKIGRFVLDSGERPISIKQKLSWAKKRLAKEGYLVELRTGDRDGMVYVEAKKLVD